MAANMYGVTYPKALVFALFSGLASYVGLAGAQHATVTSAIPYGLGVGLVVALFSCAAVAYKNGQPNRR